MRKFKARTASWALVLGMLAGLVVAGGGVSRAAAVGSGLRLTQSAAPGTPVAYTLLLANAGATPREYRLKVQGLPGGTAVFLKDGRPLSRVVVRPEAPVELALQVTTPAGQSAGHYPVEAVAVRDDGAETVLPLDLRVETAGDLRLETAVSRLTGLSGKELEFPVTVTNRGVQVAASVHLTVDAPPKWRVSVTPEQVAQVGPGQSAGFRVRVAIPPSQDAGNQELAVAALAGDGAAAPAGGATATVRVVVEKGSGYLVVPLLLLGAAFLGTVTYIRRHGRR